MNSPLFLDAKPQIVPPLDPGFRPMALANRAFHHAVAHAGGGRRLTLTLERPGGNVTRYQTRIFPAAHPLATNNYLYVERLLKLLLWQKGGFRVYVSGAPELAGFLDFCYSAVGPRAFDWAFWADVYEHPFELVAAPLSQVPRPHESAGGAIRRDWRGWRIGFDLGASDRKVAVAKDGKLALKPDGTPVCSTEFPWDPKVQADPAWHFAEINSMLRHAEAAVRQVDPQAQIAAIGGSSAGIYVNNRVRIASLFRGVKDQQRFADGVAPLFLKLQEAWGGLPFRLENDGDVTALAGALSLKDGAVLGLAMGSSLAAGYVDDEQRIAGWLNELAFAPVDARPDAPADEWSRDCGVGANYHSQQAVARLIPLAGIEITDIPAGDLPKRLVRVQELMKANDPRARKIYETLGVYLGYSLGHFAEFYPAVRHAEILGRVMSGAGGEVILAEARRVLAAEFPVLARGLDFYEPNEQEKRHGQAVAAATLPLTE